MSRFASTKTKTIRAEWWDEEEEVVIKKLNHGDARQIEEAGFALEPIEGTTDNRLTISLADQQLERMARGIVSWTFLDEKGKAVKVRKAAIDQLLPEDGEFILSEIEGFNGGRSAKEQANF